MQAGRRKHTVRGPAVAVTTAAFGLAAVVWGGGALAQPALVEQSALVEHSGLMAQSALMEQSALVEQAAQHAPPAKLEPLSLGMQYLIPPHVPGAKVRTPEGPAPLLAQRLAKDLSLKLVKVDATADALLIAVDDAQTQSTAGVVIPTGYSAGIMAIMRTDTDIKRWEDLRGRIVCLTEESGLSGQMQARYGAIERVFRAPADALLDLRIGGCDATVHDSTLLQALLQFPEWQKFSASLPVQEVRELAFVLPDPNHKFAQHLQSRVKQWQDAGLLQKLTEQSARDIAFEVYMDQEVPDCH